MSEELEIPVSEGAKSTEENVLAIYIYCPELLYEDSIDKNLFAYPPHKQLFEAIKCGLEGGSWNKAVFPHGLVDDIRHLGSHHGGSGVIQIMQFRVLQHKRDSCFLNFHSKP